ncbi:hypothetical protein M2427_008025 [Bradyrhizobium sp. BR13661]|jgi:hypothetical protein|nr:hypothetical protein [Bradyrhizobium sp. BR13661]
MCSLGGSDALSLTFKVPLARRATTSSKFVVAFH